MQLYDSTPTPYDAPYFQNPGLGFALPVNGSAMPSSGMTMPSMQAGLIGTMSMMQMMPQSLPSSYAAPSQPVQSEGMQQQLMWSAMPAQYAAAAPVLSSGTSPSQISPSQMVPVQPGFNGFAGGQQIMMMAVPVPMENQQVPAVQPIQEIEPPPVPTVQRDKKANAGRQMFSEALDSDVLDAETSSPESQTKKAAVVLNPGQMTSPGSALHGTGRCNPCAWYWKPKGCMNAVNCQYCHLCPEGELKQRKKAKVTAMRMGALEPTATEHGSAPPRIKLTQLLA
jgi:hypothetical protein